MIKIRKSNERGETNIGWLKSWHSFSFGDYYDPKNMGFGALRVINDDIVAPNGGFPDHGHRDMEIVTYILDGALQHRDSMGNTSVIRPGQIQRMSAGKGVIHSEFNPSDKEPVHLLQIWIMPDVKSISPEYEEKDIANNNDRLALIVSKDGRDSSVKIHQDADVYAAKLSKGASVTHKLRNPLGWLQVAKGEVEINGKKLEAGDAAAIEDEKELTIASKNGGEVLLFDLQPLR